MTKWIDWPGGARPVDGDLVVEAMYRNGEMSDRRRAAYFQWVREATPLAHDIVAYRVVPGAEASSEAVTKDELLDAAKAAVADRGLNYGSPEDNFARIAELWQTHLRNRGQREIVIQDFDVAMMMVLLKVARLENEPSHLDSWTDIAGYAACGATLKKGA
jgi:hypothetical protein